eukprot:g3232.t1
MLLSVSSGDGGGGNVRGELSASSGSKPKAQNAPENSVTATSPPAVPPAATSSFLRRKTRSKDHTATASALSSRNPSKELQQDVSTWCLVLEPGDSRDLIRFLEISRRWFATLITPPSKQDFKLFLEGGYANIFAPDRTDEIQCAEAPPSPVATASARTHEINDSKQQLLLEFLDGQGQIFKEEILPRILEAEEAEEEGFVDEEHEEQLERLLEAENWQNISLESFLDAATDVSGFRSGEYEQSWEFLLDFFKEGQTAE